MEKVVIFGSTQFSKMLYNLISRDNTVEVVAFTINEEYINKDEESISGLPIVPFEKIETIFPPTNYKILNSIGYSKMNMLRDSITESCLLKGYKMYSYISRDATILSHNTGVGNIILPNSFIGYDVELGDNNIVYTGSILTHNISLGNNIFVAASCTIGGNVTIGNNCFLGLNSTIKNRVKIGDFSLIGAAAYISKDIEPFSVYVPERSVKLVKNSIDLI